MLEQLPCTRRVTVGADKGYDSKELIAECRNLTFAPATHNPLHAHG